MSIQPLFQYKNHPTSDCPSAFPDATSDKKAVDQYLTQLLSQSLSQRYYTEINPALSDKWLAVSSLHKSIRRGEANLALQATAALLKIDPDYLFRRLPVIAYEDIAIANPTLCAKVLFASSKKVQKTFGIEQLAYNLVEQMALSVKSRTTTDIYCLLLSDPNAEAFISSCLAMNPAQWVDIAKDTELRLTHRMAAIKLITGHSLRKDTGYYQTFSKANSFELNRLCEEMHLTGLTNHLVTNGQSKTLGLNGAYILADEMRINSPTCSIIKHEFNNPNDHGVINCAFDQYCKAGRDVIAKFVSTSEPLQQFFKLNKIKHPAKLIGVMLFINEGCKADKQLDFDGMLKLQRQVENMELFQAGIKTTIIAEKLLAILNAEMPLLQSLRHQANVRRFKFFYTDINQLTFAGNCRKSDI